MFKDPRTGKHHSVQSNYDNQDFVVNDRSETFQDMENTNVLTLNMSMNTRHRTKVDEVREYTVVNPRPSTRTFGDPINQRLKTDWR